MDLVKSYQTAVWIYSVPINYSDLYLEILRALRLKSSREIASITATLKKAKLSEDFGSYWRNSIKNRKNSSFSL